MFRRAAITVVEVLIVIVLIAIVIALLLPAMQSARDRAHLIEGLAGGEDVHKLGDVAAGVALVEPEDEAQLGSDEAVADLPRRIVYEAELTLVVEDVAGLEARIHELVKQHGGYVADASVDRRQGAHISGYWRVRIPVDQFDRFLEAASKLGVAERRHQTAQDVTEEYVDLEARIANKKRLEARIVQLLEDSSGEIKDVIEVERELARVRSEIEQMQGRLRFLTNRTELTTVSISAREERNYVPPEAPSFTARVRQAWSSSLLALKVFGQRVAVAAVYAFPWIVIASVVLVPAIWYAGRRKAAARKSTPGEGP